MKVPQFEDPLVFIFRIPNLPWRWRRQWVSQNYFCIPTDLHCILPQKTLTSYSCTCKRDISHGTEAFVSVTAGNFGLELAKRQKTLQITWTGCSLHDRAFSRHSKLHSYYIPFHDTVQIGGLEGLHLVRSWKYISAKVCTPDDITYTTATCSTPSHSATP